VESAGPADGFRIRVRTQYAALEGRHPDPDPVPNTHIVSLDWTRIELDLAVPLSDSIDLELQLPYDIKDVKARYELPDGTPFDNPLGDLHHRTEKLEGVSDFKLYWNFNVDGWRLSAGVNLPVGRIEQDPYALGALGLRHEHIQFGTGTCDPLARVSRMIHVLEGVDLSFGAGAQVALVENRNGYRAPPTIDFAAGPRVQILDWLGVSAMYSALYQGRAYWSGNPDPNTGYLIQGFQVSLPIRIGPGILIVPNVFRAFDTHLRDGGDAFELDWIAGLTVEVPLGGSRKPTTEEKPHSHE
jgi:hypothetical protein